MSEFDYDNLPEVKGEIISFDEVGQKICGTFVGKSDPINTKYGENFLYEFQDDEGNIKKCWARKSISDVMKLFKFGTIIKIEYVASHPSKKGNDFKEFKIFGNNSIVNEDWLASSEKNVSPAGEDENESKATRVEAGQPDQVSERQQELDFEGMKKHPFLGESEKKTLLTQISELAVGKLGATDGEDVRKKVMEATNLAFVDSNLVKIAEALSVMPERS